VTSLWFFLMFSTPVALIIFRRPDLTARVVEALAQVKPRKLLVIADGPRHDRGGEAELCAVTRAVIDRIDWECEILKNYSDVNLGCGQRPATGITWVFEQVEQAIILEDDCVPHPSFFRFCEEMLARYRDDQRVMHIAGCSYRREPWPTPYSYYFSLFNGAWGWATWRRAWRHFDQSLKLWPELRGTSWLADVLEDSRAVHYWSTEFDVAYERHGDVSYWDHQWTFACWANSGLSVAPRENLVSNIGCGPHATHTFDPNDLTGNLPAVEMRFPLNHPPVVLGSRELDRQKLRESILPRLPAPPSPLQRVRQMAGRMAPDSVKQLYRRLAAGGSPQAS
jgi:hypothetical protein